MSWLVSACLLGTRCRYDGCSKAHPGVQDLVAAAEQRGVEVVPVCPEELGGLPTPRPPAELKGGDGAAVLARHAAVRRLHDGADLSTAFIEGARRAVARAPQASTAWLKARSPSCGCGRTHIDGRVAPGDGVFAALLRARGVTLHTEEELPTPPQPPNPGSSEPAPAPQGSPPP